MIEIPTFTRYADQPLQHSAFVVVIDGTRYGVGFINEGQEGRQVFQGPMVPGPWGYTFGLATVIDNFGGTAAEAASNRAAGMEVTAEYGDRFRANGQVYELTPGIKFQTGPRFVPVTDEEL